MLMLERRGLFIYDKVPRMDFVKGRHQKNQAEWLLIQTFCSPYHETSKQRAPEIRYVRCCFRCHNPWKLRLPN